MHIETLDEAIAVYFDECDNTAPIPANSSDYDEALGGWVLENVNGPLALVRTDGTVVAPVLDPKAGEWVFDVAD